MPSIIFKKVCFKVDISINQFSTLEILIKDFVAFAMALVDYLFTMLYIKSQIAITDRHFLSASWFCNWRKGGAIILSLPLFHPFSFFLTTAYVQAEFNTLTTDVWKSRAVQKTHTYRRYRENEPSSLSRVSHAYGRYFRVVMRSIAISSRCRGAALAWAFLKIAPLRSCAGRSSTRHLIRRTKVRGRDPEAA